MTSKKVCCKGKGRQTEKRREKEVNTRALQLLDAMSTMQRGQADGTMRGTIDSTLHPGTINSLVNPTTVKQNIKLKIWNFRTLELRICNVTWATWNQSPNVN